MNNLMQETNSRNPFNSKKPVVKEVSRQSREEGLNQTRDNRVMDTSDEAKDEIDSFVVQGKQFLRSKRGSEAMQDETLIGEDPIDRIISNKNDSVSIYKKAKEES